MRTTKNLKETIKDLSHVVNRPTFCKYVFVKINKVVPSAKVEVIFTLLLEEMAKSFLKGEVVTIDNCAKFELKSYKEKDYMSIHTGLVKKIKPKNKLLIVLADPVKKILLKHLNIDSVKE